MGSSFVDLTIDDVSEHESAQSFDCMDPIGVDMSADLINLLDDNDEAGNLYVLGVQHCPVAVSKLSAHEKKFYPRSVDIMIKKRKYKAERKRRVVHQKNEKASHEQHFARKPRDSQQQRKISRFEIIDLVNEDIETLDLTDEASFCLTHAVTQQNSASNATQNNEAAIQKVSFSEAMPEAALRGNSHLFLESLNVEGSKTVVRNGNQSSVSKSRKYTQLPEAIRRNDSEFCNDLEHNSIKAKKFKEEEQNSNCLHSLPEFVAETCNFIIIDESSDEDSCDPKNIVLQGNPAKKHSQKTNLGCITETKFSEKDTFKCYGEKDFNWLFSNQRALELQEQLFKEAAERVSFQTRIHVKPRAPSFEEPIFDISLRFPDHWRWKDPYSCLGLPHLSPLHLIKSQYRRLARIYHPDKSKLPTANKFHAVVTAYRKLAPDKS